MNMSEESKYYPTPIEDIRIGYECEMGVKRLKPPQPSDERWIEWRTVTINDPFNDNINYYIESELIRTPFLNKDQIIAEGWQEIHDEEYIKVLDTKEGEPSQVWWFNNNSNSEYQSTFEFRYRGYNNIKFQGEIKSINEFRYITKLLGI